MDAVPTLDDAIYCALHLASGAPHRRAIGMEPLPRDLVRVHRASRERIRPEELDERVVAVDRKALLVGLDKGWLEFPRLAAEGSALAPIRTELVELLASRDVWLDELTPPDADGVYHNTRIPDRTRFALTARGDEEYRRRAATWWEQHPVAFDDIVFSVLTAAIYDLWPVAIPTWSLDSELSLIHDDIRTDVENQALTVCAEKGWLDFYWWSCGISYREPIVRVDAAFARPILGSPALRDPGPIPGVRPPATGRLFFFKTPAGHGEWRARADRRVAGQPPQPLHVDGIAGTVCWSIRGCDGGNVRKTMAALEIHRPDVPPTQLRSALVEQLRRLFDTRFITLVRHDPNSDQCPEDGTCCGPMTREEFERVLADPRTWDHGPDETPYYFDKGDEFDVTLWPYLDYQRP